jgi:hypothetical protein
MQYRSCCPPPPPGDISYRCEYPPLELWGSQSAFAVCSNQQLHALKSVRKCLAHQLDRVSLRGPQIQPICSNKRCHIVICDGKERCFLSLFCSGGEGGVDTRRGLRHALDSTRRPRFLHISSAHKIKNERRWAWRGRPLPKRKKKVFRSCLLVSKNGAPGL